MAGGVHGKGAFVAGGVHGRGHAWRGGMCGRGHVWQGGVHGRGACMVGALCSFWDNLYASPSMGNPGSAPELQNTWDLNF